MRGSGGCPMSEKLQFVVVPNKVKKAEEVTPLNTNVQPTSGCGDRQAEACRTAS